MTKVLVTEAYLEDIADSIRAKTGSQSTYKPSEMSDAIDAISGGGITPTGTKSISITENGTTTEDVTTYASAQITVDVSGGSTPTLQTKTVTPTESTQNVTPDSGYDGLSQVTVNPIPSSYVQPSGTLNITANDTYDVTNYASANVNISASSANETAILDGSITTYSNSDITTLRSHAFNSCSNLTSISLANLTTMNGGAFQSCSSLATINFPSLTSITGGSAFRYCSSLINVSLPLANVTNTGYSHTFADCTALKIAVLPGWTQSMPNNTFTNDSSLETVDAPFNSFFTGGFYNCTKLKTLILRKTASIATLQSVAVFTTTPFESGGSGGTIYVPRALISDYQTATNWSTLYAAGTVTFTAIEGSQYENYYADGTAIS